jgi:CheY-like chemotaxis protein
MEQVRILLVDDEEHIRLLFKEELEEEGYFIGLASNGFEALDVLRSGHFDIVVLDIKMPGMDGIQTLNEIKKLNKDQRVISLLRLWGVQAGLFELGFRRVRGKISRYDGTETDYQEYTGDLTCKKSEGQ